jgi:hypothetical protein
VEDLMQPHPLQEVSARHFQLHPLPQTAVVEEEEPRMVAMQLRARTFQMTGQGLEVVVSSGKEETFGQTQQAVYRF